MTDNSQPLQFDSPYDINDLLRTTPPETEGDAPSVVGHYVGYDSQTNEVLLKTGADLVDPAHLPDQSTLVHVPPSDVYRIEPTPLDPDDAIAVNSFKTSLVIAKPNHIDQGFYVARFVGYDETSNQVTYAQGDESLDTRDNAPDATAFQTIAPQHVRRLDPAYPDDNTMVGTELQQNYFPETKPRLR